MSRRTGLVEGRLRPCPGSPNCVCSQDPEPARRVEPWPYEGDADAARDRLLEALRCFPRTSVVTAEPRYVHATFTSLLFRFVDDVELLLDDEAKLVHVRSASRLGYSDLGVNARRVAALRAAFEGSG